MMAREPWMEVLPPAMGHYGGGPPGAGGWFVQARAWTPDENKRFQWALVGLDLRCPDWDKVARYTGKTVLEVVDHFKSLELDVHQIESGLVPFPVYGPGAAASAFTLQWDGSGGAALAGPGDFRHGYRFGGCGGGKRHGGRTPEQERKKGVPWTEDEHNMDWEPTLVPLGLLLEITDGFSAERKLGSGSYGEVYLGVHKDGQKIAVKRIYDMPGVDEKQFQNEFKNLTMLRHQNIVRLVGYCHDIQEVQVKHEGKLVVADKIQRALCLEYMSNGSLEKYISDECDKYDWCTCYGIIKGVCQGVKYLHNELTPPIYHLDLKPANILLDENMVPRIADFGISRLFGDEKTRATISSLGTTGYLPPEYIRNNLISSKFDIFSLGVVIIKIMAGRAGYFKSAEMSSWEFTNLVQENWTNRLHETSNLKKAYSEQVKKCIEIGLSCVQEDRHKRPTIQDIVDRLNETETECTYEYKKFDECWNLGGHPVREMLLNYDAGPSQQEFGDRRPLNGFSQAAVLSNNDAGPSNRETLPSSQPTYGQILHQGLGEYDPSMSQNGNVLNDQGPLSAESTMPFYNFLSVPQDVEDVAGTYPDGVSLETSSLNPVPVVMSSGPPLDEFDKWLDEMLAGQHAS